MALTWQQLGVIGGVRTVTVAADVTGIGTTPVEIASFQLAAGRYIISSSAVIQRGTGTGRVVTLSAAGQSISHSTSSTDGYVDACAAALDVTLPEAATVPVFMKSDSGTAPVRCKAGSIIVACRIT